MNPAIAGLFINVQFINNLIEHLFVACYNVDSSFIRFWLFVLPFSYANDTKKMEFKLLTET